MQKHDHSHEVRHTGATGTRHAHRPTTAICKKNGKGTRKYNKKHDHDTQVQLELDTPNNYNLQKKNGKGAKNITKNMTMTHRCNWN